MKLKSRDWDRRIGLAERCREDDLHYKFHNFFINFIDIQYEPCRAYYAFSDKIREEKCPQTDKNWNKIIDEVNLDE